MSTTTTGNTMNKEMHPSPTLFPVVPLNSHCSAAILLCPGHINSIVRYPQITRLSLFFCCADQSVFDTTASQKLSYLFGELTESQHSEDKCLGAQTSSTLEARLVYISTPVRLEAVLLVSQMPASPGNLLASANLRFIQSSGSLNLVKVNLLKSSR